ncbi:MAG: hypothetical protein ACYTDU_13520 [Planctomycetota bacterium]
MTPPRCTLMLTVIPLLAAILATGGPLRAGCDDRSGASQGKLKIAWLVVTGVAPEAAATGAGSKAVEDSEWADKPMMVYIPSDDPTDSITRKLNSVVFKNEKVGIGAKFFETLKISRRHALDDRLLVSHADPTPQIVFLKRNFTEHAALQKKQISASKLLKTMKSLVRAEYINDFDAMVRAYGKLLDELDRLESRKEVLTKQRQRLEDQPNPAKERKLEREEKARRSSSSCASGETRKRPARSREEPPAGP